jgi:hypothetical protein
MLIDLEHPIWRALIVVPQGPLRGFRTVRDHGRLGSASRPWSWTSTGIHITHDFPDLKVAAQWRLEHPDRQGKEDRLTTKFVVVFGLPA